MKFLKRTAAVGAMALAMGGASVVFFGAVIVRAAHMRAGGS